MNREGVAFPHNNATYKFSYPTKIEGTLMANSHASAV